MKIELLLEVDINATVAAQALESLKSASVSSEIRARASICAPSARRGRISTIRAYVSDTAAF